MLPASRIATEGLVVSGSVIESCGIKCVIRELYWGSGRKV